MSSGSVLIPGIRKVRAWKMRVKTMLTELNLCKEFAFCSVDELRCLQFFDTVGWATGRASGL